MSVSVDLVRVCPSCGTHHPADRLRCQCGALLFGVDLVRPVALEAGDASEGPVRNSGEPPLAGATEATVRCPHDDCGQLNPAGSQRCLYCNRSLESGEAAAPAAAAPPLPLLQLPSALRSRYRVLEAFEARGAEADILLVEPCPHEGKVPAALVAKIYRQGILPSAEVQARIARVDAPHRVTVFETGSSDGRAYEVMEYCTHGSLRQYMGRQAQPVAFISEVIRELAGALKAVHEASLVHRDLKPENVLLRSEQPLDLVLTDFSTASVMDATQRFTGMARTLLYAAPEALSGVLDAKADYWALGMLLLEMATGAHPFQGLSEAVILHHLTTRAMDVSGAPDQRLRQLLGGLLLRNPKRRWGASEITRWLAGDESLTVAMEEGGEPGFAQPYSVLHERCTTPEQLAVAFARHWQAGVADLASGQLLRWFTEVQKDQNAIRLLLALRYDSHLSGDEQLLRFILHFAPGIPPMWQGRGVELPALLIQASQALQGDDAAAEWLSQLHRDRVLNVYAAAGNAQAAEVAERWHTAAENFETAWAACLALLERRATPARGPAEVVLFDEAVYGQGANIQPAHPRPAELHPRLLASAYDQAWVERLRGRLVREWAALTVRCPWLVELGDPHTMASGQLLACEALLPEMRKVVLRQERQEAFRRQQQADARTELHEAFQASLAQIRQHARQVPYLFPAMRLQLLSLALDDHAELMARLRAHADTDDEWLSVRRHALRCEPLTLRLRDLCDRLSEQLAANEGWLSEQAMTFGLLGAIAAAFFLGLRIMFTVLAVATVVVLWRTLPALQMAHDIHRLAKGL